ncbi:hypothetical protein [Rhodocytophaga rosea]|uniref:hypothetical protein n=1 Tax=Rhodocytophaga rosea TaxID=2704465 RepID=UPI0018DA1592|nr:hypothetical protein [Rhodocytophaga rosea]
MPLSLPTFSSVAELAGISRVYGGFHIQTDNIDGLVLGRKIASRDWKVIEMLFDGKIA